MALLDSVKFSFVSTAVPADAFAVTSFEGREGLSQWYRIEINLVSQSPDIDLNEILLNTAVFTIHRDDGDVPIHGVLSCFVQEHAYRDYYFYRAVLVPRLWWLTLTYHNQIFLDKTIPEIIKAVLEESGLYDYEFRLRHEYQPKEYICQYRETHFNFISHWMEQTGLYYFFEQTDRGEKLVITDTALSHSPTPQNPKLSYSQPSGLDHGHWQEIIGSLSCNQQVVPQNVMLKDYNYRRPSLELTGHADVSPQNGRGKAFIYGDHFRTVEEGDHLAQIRAEGYLCREKIFTGSGSVPYLSPGYTFNLENHFRADYNQTYLVTELTHQGVQGGYLVSGLQDALSEAENQLHYSNTFSAGQASVQYRPDHLTPKSRFYGVINARIDAAGSGQYAELDDQGRYKVVMPFDTSGRKDGKASTWLRMAQPYAGSEHGMHFPLHKGVEVLVTFIDGDPDRPIITAAVPNPENASVVTSANQSMAQIVTAGKNKIQMEDKEDGQRILLHTPGANTFLRLGAPNDPPNKSNEADNKDKSVGDTWKEKGVLLNTDGPLTLQIGKFKIEVVTGVTLSIFVGGQIDQTLGVAYHGFFGSKIEIIRPWRFMFAHSALEGKLNEVKNTIRSIQVGDVNININGTQTKLSNKLTQLTNSLNTVTTTTSNLTNSQTVMINDVNRLSGNVNRVIGTGIDSYKTKINAITNAINTIGTSLSQITVNQTDVNTNVQTVGTNLETTQNSIKNAGTNITTSNLTIIN